MKAIFEHSDLLNVDFLCSSLGVCRASYYRFLQPKSLYTEIRQKYQHPRALSKEEKELVIKEMNSERFMDLPPQQIFTKLLDEGKYICSSETMYRILGENEQLRERRDQLVHPHYTKPELLATRPNEVWSWDITKLLSAKKWTYFHLYVILDIFSRYVVGWTVATKECGELATILIQETSEKQNIKPGQLTLHADRGSSMKSKPLALLLIDLGIEKTHNRPYVSNDNPFSESHFKTMKYRPEFPDRFNNIEEARAFCQKFFQWYNWEHYHSGINFFTPGSFHHGDVEEIVSKRQKVLDSAYSLHPERFVRKPPKQKRPPEAVYINPPESIKKVKGQ